MSTLLSHGIPGRQFRFILNPVSADHDINGYIDLLRRDSISADVEVIPIQKVNEAYERLLKCDVKYRFSIDMASLRSE